MAIVEIIIAVAIYWYIAYTYNFYWHIIISILITPIFLLRSTDAIKWSLDSFYTKLNQKKKNKSSNYVLFDIISFIVTLLVVHILYPFLLSNSNYFILFLKFYVFSLLYIGIILAVSISLGFTTKKDNKSMILQLMSYPIIIIIIYMLFIENDYHFIGRLTPILSALVLVNLLLVTSIRSVKNDKDSPSLAIVGGGFGLVFVAIYFKTIAVMKYIDKGMSSFKSNWVESNINIDVFKIAEIIYTIEDDSRFDDDMKLSKLFNIKYINVASKITGFINIIGYIANYITYYFITLLYRLSIKASFWFYLPLVFVIKSPNLMSSKDIGMFLSEQYQTIWAWLRGLLAIGTISAFIITYFKYYAFSEVVNIPFISVISMLYLDFSSLEIWKIFQLLVAVLTIVLFLYANAIRVPAVANNIPLEKDYRIMIIYYLNGFRNWISLFYFTSAFIFLAYYFKVWEYQYMPHFMENLLFSLVQYIQYKPFG